MLHIKTTVQPDKYGGLGLFADEPLEKGRVIWAYNRETTRFVSVSEYHKLEKSEKYKIERYGYPVYSLDTPSMIGIILELDNSRYTNHSSNPNVDGIGDVNAGFKTDIALRDIEKGVPRQHKLDR